MRDRNALVTRDIRRESQHPVPALPDPTIPALYRALWSPNIMSSSYVPRAARLGMMSEADTIHEQATGLATIEGIDLDADVACAAKGHDHPADIIIAGHCPGCDWRPMAARCWDWWQQRGRMRCPKCDTRGARDDMAWIVEVLR